MRGSIDRSIGSFKEIGMLLQIGDISLHQIPIREISQLNLIKMTVLGLPKQQILIHQQCHHLPLLPLYPLLPLLFLRPPLLTDHHLQRIRILPRHPLNLLINIPGFPPNLVIRIGLRQHTVFGCEIEIELVVGGFLWF